MVAAVGDIDLIGGIVNRNPVGTVERRLAIRRADIARLADLQQKLSAARVLRHVRVGQRGRSGRSRTTATSRWRLSRASRSRRAASGRSRTAARRTSTSRRRCASRRAAWRRRRARAPARRSRGFSADLVGIHRRAAPTSAGRRRIETIRRNPDIAFAVHGHPAG